MRSHKLMSYMLCEVKKSSEKRKYIAIKLKLELEPKMEMVGTVPAANHVSLYCKIGK